MRNRGTRNRGSRFLPTLYVVGFLFCLGVILYPLLANFYYEAHQSMVITAYEEDIAAASQIEVEEELELCREYNKKLRDLQITGVQSDTGNAIKGYYELLDSGKGIMGYLEIPKIGLYLPVYHDVTDSVLQSGLGHLPETSLPVGGEGSHSVITGHSGMSDKRLFTDLIDLNEGDFFAFHVLGETHYYHIERIETVLPDETENLLVEEGKDIITLVTCVPLGINSHRLLVRGIRLEDDSQDLLLESSNNGFGTWTAHYLLTITETVLVIAGIAGIMWLIRRKRHNKPFIQEPGE